MANDDSMHSLVYRRLDKLLRALEDAADVARDKHGVEEVHQLRVATRRLSQNLKTFRPFFAKEKAGKVRRRLRGLRDIAADLRTRDIALAQWQAARLPESAAFPQRLQQERAEAAEKLQAELARWRTKRYPDRWRRTLGTKGSA